jgi:hypothetical protein
MLPCILAQLLHAAREVVGGWYLNRSAAELHHGSWDSWLPSKVQEERAVPSTVVHRIIICELHRTEPNIPIIHSWANVHPEHLLKCTIDALSLPVSLRVIRRRHTLLSSIELAQVSEHIASEPRVSIGDNFGRQAMLCEHPVKQQIRRFQGRDLCLTGQEICHF